MYVFSEASTRHAISRSSYRKFEKGDIVQLNLSAKIDGYSAAIGYPIVLGKLEGHRRDVVLFGLEAHNWTEKQIKAGVMACDVAKQFYDYYVANGYKDNFVYGPMHGTGIIEVEAPWVETTSNYPFKPNMTFQIVGSAESNPREQRISNESPVGAGLLGHKLGETVDIQTPGGLTRLRILRIQ